MSQCTPSTTTRPTRPAAAGAPSPAFVPPHPSLPRNQAPLDRIAADPRRRRQRAPAPRCAYTLSSSAALPPSLTLPCPNSETYLTLLSLPLPLLLPRLSALTSSQFEPLPSTSSTGATPSPTKLRLSTPTSLPSSITSTTTTTLPSPQTSSSNSSSSNSSRVLSPPNAAVLPSPFAPDLLAPPKRPPPVTVAAPNLRNRTYAYNRSLNRLCRRRRALHPCLAVLAEMRHRGVPADKYTYSAVLTAVARAGARDVAVELYHQIRSDGVTLDDYLRASLLKVAGSGERPQLDLCVRLFRGTRRPSRVVCNVMMDAYANAGRVDDCVATFRHMAAVGLVPDAYSISALTKGYVAAGRPKEALDNLTQVRASGLDVPAAACGQVMDALGKQGDLDGAVAVFDTMTLWGVTPTRVTYNILIMACAAAADAARAFEVFDDMRHVAGFSPDRYTIHGLMKACLATRQPQRALALYRDLNDNQPFYANQISYRLAFVAAGMALDEDAVDAVVADMARNGCNPRMDTAASAVAAAIRCADLQAARALFMTYVDAKKNRRTRAGEADTRQLFGAMRTALREMDPADRDSEDGDCAQTAQVVDELERRWLSSCSA